ncbi:MAG: hypothetical protein M3N07_00990 [Pseudomonadota bacterium]|nr:hypothetical protein [Pseudomonadota bacterium]
MDDSAAALKRFQSIVAEIVDSEGDGYDIFTTHRCSDRSGNLTDRVIITLS